MSAWFRTFSSALLLPIAFTAYAQTKVDWAPMPNPDPRLAAMRQSGGARLRAPGQVAISPDGALLAWTIGGREGSALHLTDVANPDPRQGQDRLSRRRDRLLERRARMVARLSDPRLHLDLHFERRQARPAADLPLLPRRRHRQTTYPPHRNLPAGRVLARRQIAGLSVCRKRLPQRRRAGRDEALVRRHR